MRLCCVFGSVEQPDDLSDERIRNVLTMSKVLVFNCVMFNETMLCLDLLQSQLHNAHMCRHKPIHRHWRQLRWSVKAAMNKNICRLRLKQLTVSTS